MMFGMVFKILKAIRHVSGLRRITQVGLLVFSRIAPGSGQLNIVIFLSLALT